METVLHIFFRFEPENAIFDEFWNPWYRGHLAFFNSYSSFRRQENSIFAESWNPGDAYFWTESAISSFVKPVFLVPFLECDYFFQYDAKKFDFSWVPSIFCISAGCKCDLYLLTRSGRSFDGNWTFCWRKLDYSWRKLDGLLTETGRSLEGNWIVWIRKLDRLLTESGWSIDVNWTDYWWKEWSLLMKAVQQIFIILGARKYDFAEFWNPRLRGHQEFFYSFSAFWRLESAIFAESWNPEFNGTKIRVSKFYAFWHPQNAISDDSRNQCF